MSSTIVSVGKGGYRTDAVIDPTKNFTPQTGCHSDDGGAACLTLPPGGVTQNIQPPYPTNFWLSQVVLPPDNSDFNAAFYPLPQTLQFMAHGFTDLTNPSKGTQANGINLMAAQFLPNQADHINLLASLYGQQPLMQATDLMKAANILPNDIDGVMNALTNGGYITNLSYSNGHPTSGVINIVQFTPHKPNFNFNLSGYPQYSPAVEQFLQQTVDTKCLNLLASPAVQAHFEPLGDGFMIYPSGVSGNTIGNPHNFKRPLVDRYDDWSADLLLNTDQAGSATLTVARGVPIAWFNLNDLDLQVNILPRGDTAYLVYAAKDPHKGTNQPPSSSYFGILFNGQLWAVFLPDGGQCTFFTPSGQPLTVDPATGNAGGVFWFASNTSKCSARYMSIMLLPDEPDSGVEPTTLLEKYAPYGYSRVTGAIADWTVNDDCSVTTTFKATVELLPSPPTGLQVSDQTLLGLLPHHYNRDALQAIDTSPPPAQPLGTFLQGPRGAVKLYAGSQFTVQHGFCGVLPYLPSAFSGGTGDLSKLQSYLGTYPTTIGNDWTNNMWAKGPAGLYAPYEPQDTYNAGKQMAVLAQYWVAANIAGETQTCQDVIGALKAYLTTWLSPITTDPKDPTQTNLPFYYFYYDKDYTTLLGYKPGFGSTTQLNDHHFHYGYFIQAAAFLAQHDPDFVNDYGGMVDLLIADIANTPNIQNNIIAKAVPQPNTPVFPKLRYWDCYEGHSWATGYQPPSTWGIQEESSSEAMNAWSGMILWGKIADRPDILQAGIYLYATHAASIYEYHFNASAQWTIGQNGQPQFADYGNFLPDYVDYQGTPPPANTIGKDSDGDYTFEQISCPYADVPSYCQQTGWMTAVRIFSGGYSADTDWDQYPMFRYTINWLPITASSLYLADSPNYVKTSFTQMQVASKLESDATTPSGDNWKNNYHLTYPYGWATVTLPYLALGTGNQPFAFDGEQATVSNAFDQWFNLGLKQDPNIQASNFQFFGTTVASSYYFIAALETFGTPVCNVQVSGTGGSTPLYAVFQNPTTQKYTCVVYATSEDSQITSIAFKQGNTVIGTIPGSQIKPNELIIWAA